MHHVCLSYVWCMECTLRPLLGDRSTCTQFHFGEPVILLSAILRPEQETLGKLEVLYQGLGLRYSSQSVRPFCRPE